MIYVDKLEINVYNYALKIIKKGQVMFFLYMKYNSMTSKSYVCVDGNHNQIY